MMSKLMAVVEKLQQELFDVERARKRAEGCVCMHSCLSVAEIHRKSGFRSHSFFTNLVGQVLNLESQIHSA